VTDETLLLRQVNPNFLQGERISSQVLRPTPKDENLLSVYDGDMVEPRPAWEHYTGVVGFASHGVVAVTVGECAELALPVRADPAPFPEHAVIDFSGLARGAVEKQAKRLRVNAEARGWLYRRGSHPER
jgi:hypothetical protein